MTVIEKFRKIQKQKVKASIMIEGLQGSGKSGLALAIASVLADDQNKIYAIDTENQSLDLYDKLKLHTGTQINGINKVDLTVEDGYAPSNYEALRDAAIKAGAEVLIMDSISHMWNRKGGLLDTVNEASNVMGGDSYRAWGTDKNRKEKELIFDLIRSPKVHTIVTVRSKEKFDMEKDETTGKNKVVSLGEQQVQQDGLKYEPDLVIRMVEPGNREGRAPKGIILKSRYAILETNVEYDFTPALLQQLKEYLIDGVDPEVLLEIQHKEYVEAIKVYCGENATRKSIWKTLKESAGFNGKIEEIPLKELKELYRQLIAD